MMAQFLLVCRETLKTVILEEIFHRFESTLKHDIILCMIK